TRRAPDPLAPARARARAASDRRRVQGRAERARSRLLTAADPRRGLPARPERLDLSRRPRLPVVTRPVHFAAGARVSARTGTAETAPARARPRPTRRSRS